MFYSIFLFILAGIAEIGGGYLVWIWLKEGKSPWFAVIGAILLVIYGFIPTMQRFPSFGKVYAAYGGIFIVMSLFWSWGFDKRTPDFYDWLGAAVCLVGVFIILWAPRH